jgi:hypothetical protein
VDADQVATLRALLANSGWLERVGVFGRALRTSVHAPGGLMLVGTPAYEPWHLTAHLDEESRLSEIPALMPVLVRWSPPAGAPPHLRVGLDRIEAARRGETLFVVTSATAPVPLLERVNDARRVGATILALDQGDTELDSLAHETLAVPGSAAGSAPPAGGLDEAEWTRRSGLLSFDAAQHLVSAAAGDRSGGTGSAGPRGVRGLRERLARLLDTVSGPRG